MELIILHSQGIWISADHLFSPRHGSQQYDYLLRNWDDLTIQTNQDCSKSNILGGALNCAITPPRFISIHPNPMTPNRNIRHYQGLCNPAISSWAVPQQKIGTAYQCGFSSPNQRLPFLPHYLHLQTTTAFTSMVLSSQAILPYPFAASVPTTNPFQIPHHYSVIPARTPTSKLIHERALT